jgi:hypothetical protein
MAQWKPIFQLKAGYDSTELMTVRILQTYVDGRVVKREIPTMDGTSMEAVFYCIRGFQETCDELNFNNGPKLHSTFCCILRRCAERFGNREKRKNKGPTQRAVLIQANPTSKHPLRTQKLFSCNLEILRFRSSKKETERWAPKTNNAPWYPTSIQFRRSLWSIIEPTTFEMPLIWNETQNRKAQCS